MRPYFIEQHDFYVKQTKKRVFSRFHDIESDAQRYSDTEYKGLLRRSADGNIDTDVVAMEAYDNARNYYWALTELKKQVILGATAGMYHMWEKELRDFIERELSLDYQKNDLIKIAWRLPTDEVFNLFTRSGWTIRMEPFYPMIDACRLVINVYKHGNGPSFEKLKNSFPHYLREPFGSNLPILNSNCQDHTLLTVTEDHFIEFADAFRAFWLAFPERLYIKFDEQV